MPAFKFETVAIESFAFQPAPHEVSSSEIEKILAPVYQRLDAPAGILERISGVRTRYYYDKETRPSAVGAAVAAEALERGGVRREDIGAIFSCSQMRDYFEPATSCIIHEKLGLSEQAMAMDICNACVGFSDGIVVLGNLIETGVVKAGLVVSGENIARGVQAHLDTLRAGREITRRDLLQAVLPAMTLGCGAVAMVLCHESIATSTHRLVGSMACSATENWRLCVGSGDFCATAETNGDELWMETVSREHIAAAARLGGRTWEAASSRFGWTPEALAHIFTHQVGKPVDDGFYRQMGLEFAKDFSIYQKYGNMVASALPAALVLGAQERNIKAGEKVLLAGFGSGLNSVFTLAVW